MNNLATYRDIAITTAASALAICFAYALATAHKDLAEHNADRDTRANQLAEEHAELMKNINSQRARPAPSTKPSWRSSPTAAHSRQPTAGGPPPPGGWADPPRTRTFLRAKRVWATSRMNSSKSGPAPNRDALVEKCRLPGLQQGRAHRPVVPAARHGRAQRASSCRPRLH